MYCPKCGKELRDGAAFCNRCGSSLKADHQDILGNLSRSIISKNFKKVLLIVSILSFAVALIENILGVISGRELIFTLFEWGIIPYALLLFGCVFINKMKPTLMAIPMVYPLVAYFADIVLFSNAFDVMEIIIMALYMIFAIFGILTIVKRKMPLKIISIVALVLLLLYGSYYHMMSLTALVWLIFIIGIKTHPMESNMCMSPMV